jgi:hypothetical protein
MFFLHILWGGDTILNTKMQSRAYHATREARPEFESRGTYHKFFFWGGGRDAPRFTCPKRRVRAAPPNPTGHLSSKKRGDFSRFTSHDPFLVTQTMGEKCAKTKCQISRALYST